MKRIIISAMAANRVIGGEEGLPWHIPEEYQHFLNHVKNNVMIMGRKSWQIFRKDLAQTVANVIITRSTTIDDALSASSLEEALKIAEAYNRSIYIAGGAAIYKLALDKNLVDEMYLSYIDQTPDGNAFFPEFDESEWQSTSQEFKRYRLVHYQKIN